jgi:carbamoyltransferase
MPLVEFNARPSQPQLRRFGSAGLPLTLSIAALVVWRSGHEIVACAVIILAALMLILGYCRPHWFRPLYVASAALGYPVAWLTGLLLLASIYFLLIVPVGLILRLVCRDPLARGLNREAQSYWVARPTNVDRRRYFRQY